MTESLRIGLFFSSPNFPRELGEIIFERKTARVIIFLLTQSTSVPIPRIQRLLIMKFKIVPGNIVALKSYCLKADRANLVEVLNRLKQSKFT